MMPGTFRRRRRGIGLFTGVTAAAVLLAFPAWGSLPLPPSPAKQQPAAKPKKATEPAAKPKRSSAKSQAPAKRKPPSKSGKSARPKRGVARPKRSASLTVPKVVGMTQAKAVSSLRRVGFSYSVQSKESGKPAGTVLTQAPAAGARLGRGKAVALTISAGPARPAASPTRLRVVVIGAQEELTLRVYSPSGKGPAPVTLPRSRSDTGEVREFVLDPGEYVVGLYEEEGRPASYYPLPSQVPQATPAGTVRVARGATLTLTCRISAGGSRWTSRSEPPAGAAGRR